MRLGHGVLAGVLAIVSLGCSSAVPSASAFATDAGASNDSDVAIGDASPVEVLDEVSSGEDVGEDGGQTDAANTDAANTDAPAPSPTCHDALACLLKQKLWKPGEPTPNTGDCMAFIEDSQAMEVDGLLGCVKTACKTEFDAFYAGTEAQLPALYGCMIEGCSQTLAECVGGEGKANCLESLQCMQKCSPLDDACTLPCLRKSTPYQSKKLGGVLACIFKDCDLATLSTCSVLQTCGAQCVLGG